MSRRNSLENKALRRAEREERKGAFVPTQVSFPVTNKATKITFDEEGNQHDEEVEVDSGRFSHLRTRKDRRSK